MIDRMYELMDAPDKEFDKHFNAVDEELNLRQPFFNYEERFCYLAATIKKLRSSIDQMKKHRHLLDGTPVIKI